MPKMTASLEKVTRTFVDGSSKQIGFGAQLIAPKDVHILNRVNEGICTYLDNVTTRYLSRSRAKTKRAYWQNTWYT